MSSVVNWVEIVMFIVTVVFHKHCSQNEALEKFLVANCSVRSNQQQQHEECDRAPTACYRMDG